jgi:hypothetical protein
LRKCASRKPRVRTRFLRQVAEEGHSLRGFSSKAQKKIGKNEMLSVIWENALAILLPGMPRAMRIKDPRNAMFVLAEKWPVTYGRAFQRALAFCAKAIEGKCSPSKARLAFLAAAREANVVVVR